MELWFEGLLPDIPDTGWRGVCGQDAKDSPCRFMAPGVNSRKILVRKGTGIETMAKGWDKGSAENNIYCVVLAVANQPQVA